ncbi:hypothetical protein F5H01DRAFT_340910 [Linnemannia elongata]|nr:hypothetical protein F5H01DRAFT_340910 [Linnemannia elongata]
MKILKTLSVLVAAVFATSLHAAPGSLSSRPPSAPSSALPSAPSSAPPSNTHSANGSLPGDLADLLAKVVKYDHTVVANMAAQYKAAMPSSISSQLAVDILPFCVGIAPNPTRVQIFRNAMTCDRNGFRTLYTFTAHTKQDIYLAPKPMCSALGPNPSRSMFASNKTTCGDVTWMTDFAFFESANRYQEVVMWQSHNPHRMALYPLYAGDTQGWKWAYKLLYRTHFRPASDAEMKTLRSDFSAHLKVQKKLKIDPISDVATKRCATLLIDSVVYPFVKASNAFIYAGSDLGSYVKAASEAQCSHLVKSSRIYVKRFSVGNFGSYEVMIGNKVHAAASMKVGPETLVWSLRVALQESMRAGQPVMVSMNPSSPKENIVVFVQGSIVVIGDQAKVFGASHL